MKACVFSDIHGNGPAFDQALKIIKDADADINIFLGDLCGYYFDEVEIFYRLIKIPRLKAVRGNHDQMYLDALDGKLHVREEYKNKFSFALEEFLKKDTQDIARWLRALPLQIVDQENSYACFHGSPRDPYNEYIYAHSDLSQFLKWEGIVFLGHTHEAMIRDAGPCRIMNPGSIGQPRDRKLPSILVADLNTRAAELMNFEYDYNPVLDKVGRFGHPNAWLTGFIRQSFAQ